MNTNIEIKLRALSPLLGTSVPCPAYQTAGAAAMDLHACIDAPCELIPGRRTDIPTGFALAIPEGVAGFIYPRSGLSTNHGIVLANSVGVIDSDYRGELIVRLVNTSRAPYTLAPGERFAQICFMPVYHASLIPAEELPETARGAGGFGSTSR